MKFVSCDAASWRTPRKDISGRCWCYFILKIRRQGSCEQAHPRPQRQGRCWVTCSLELQVKQTLSDCNAQDVRVCAAYCLSHILKIHAPDSPYNTAQLQVPNHLPVYILSALLKLLQISIPHFCRWALLCPLSYFVVEYIACYEADMWV